MRQGLMREYRDVGPSPDSRANRKSSPDVDFTGYLTRTFSAHAVELGHHSAQNLMMQDSVPSLFTRQPKGILQSTENQGLRNVFRNLSRARITAPVIHAFLFALASLFMLVSDKAILEGPAKVPFGILFWGDLPISAFAFSVMFTDDKNGWIAWCLWGIVGTILDVGSARSSCRFHRSGCDPTRRIVSRAQLPRSIFELQGHCPPLVVRAQALSAEAHAKKTQITHFCHAVGQKAVLTPLFFIQLRRDAGPKTPDVTPAQNEKTPDRLRPVVIKL
jgi:hypothetical protein